MNSGQVTTRRLSSVLQNSEADVNDEVFVNTEIVQEREDRTNVEKEACHLNSYPESSLLEDTDQQQPGRHIGILLSEAAKERSIDEVTLPDIILDPDGKVTYYWLGIVTLAVVYDIAVTVLRLAFQELRDPELQDSVFYILDTYTDLIFILDVIMSTRISYYDDGCLVLDPVKVAEQYRNTTKFKMDLIALLPLATVYNFITGVQAVLLSGVLVSDNINLALVRMPRLLKYPTMTKFFYLTDSRSRHPTLVRATKLSFHLWVVIHWIGCFYYMVSEYEGLGINEWVYPNGTEFSPLYRKYVRVQYWSLMTLTTIGERPAPETDLEFVFTGITFLIGVFVFAAVVGNVGDVISNMNAARLEFQSRMDQIKSYLQHRKVPERIQDKVKHWAEYTWKWTQAVDEPALLQMLPDRLRSEIAINVHLDTLKKIKIFEECEEGLLRELVLKLRSQVFSPGDYICRIGEIGRDMYIVNHGKVEILVPNGKHDQRTVVATLHSGNYFGEISLLKLEDGLNRRNADVRAVGFSELLRLSRRDLMLALVEYPNAKRILESQAIERVHKTKIVRRECGTDIPTVPEPTHQEEKPLKKSDLLLQVIKSDNFQRLMSSKKSEATELRSILSELKQFDSQTTKNKLELLKTEKDTLEAELQSTKQELEALKQRYEKLTTVYIDDGILSSTTNPKDQIQIQRRKSSGGQVRALSTWNKTSQYLPNGTQSMVMDESNIGRSHLSYCKNKCKSKTISMKNVPKSKTETSNKCSVLHQNSTSDLVMTSQTAIENVESNSLTIIPNDISKISDVNMNEEFEAENADNLTTTLTVLENILTLDHDLVHSESDDSDMSSETSEEAIS